MGTKIRCETCRLVIVTMPPLEPPVYHRECIPHDLRGTKGRLPRATTGGGLESQ